MAKTSLIAIISVWHCVAYGQLSVNIPYYIPHISTFVTQPHCHQNYDDGTVLGGNGGELLERNSPFHGALFVKIRRLEAITANLAKQLKDTTAKLEQNISDLNVELKSKTTKDDLAKKADQSELIKTNAALQTTKDDLAIKADQSKLDQTNTELKTTINNLEITTKNLATTRMELSDTKSDVEDLTKKINAMTTSEIVDIGRMPTSCSDLETMGHKLSGFFSVKGSVKMEMIYCNFNPNQNDKQKWIGYADVKSGSVHFYVQRDSPFDTKGTPIPFDLPVVNEGNAMDWTTGIFTAPRPGIYFFSFAGMVRLLPGQPVGLGVALYLNGIPTGAGLAGEGITVTNKASSFTVQSTLNLKKDDQVWLQIDLILTGATLYDDSNHFTHFTGFMLEEEIVASL